MIQVGSCQNSHLIINVLFKRLDVKAGIVSLPFAIFVVQKKKYEYTRTLWHITSRLEVKNSSFQHQKKSFIN